MPEAPNNQRLEEFRHWAERTDAFDKVLFRAIFMLWAKQHELPAEFNGKPITTINVARTIRAFPELIAATMELRRSIPDQKIRRYLRRQARAALLGDLQEGYHRERQKLGTKQANRWFCFQILHSVFPLLWAELKRLSGLQAILKRIGW
jgi:hypothetical protein